MADTRGAPVVLALGALVLAAAAAGAAGIALADPVPTPHPVAFVTVGGVSAGWLPANASDPPGYLRHLEGRAGLLRR